MVDLSVKPWSICLDGDGRPALVHKLNQNEPEHDKTNKMTVRPAKTDQPGHPPSLIRFFAVHMKKP